MKLYQVFLILTVLLALVPVVYAKALDVERLERGDRQRDLLVNKTKDLVQEDRRCTGDKRAKPVSLLKSILRGVMDLAAVPVKLGFK